MTRLPLVAFGNTLRQAGYDPHDSTLFAADHQQHQPPSGVPLRDLYDWFTSLPRNAQKAIMASLAETVTTKQATRRVREKLRAGAVTGIGEKPLREPAIHPDPVVRMIDQLLNRYRTSHTLESSVVVDALLELRNLATHPSTTQRKDHD